MRRGCATTMPPEGRPGKRSHPPVHGDAPVMRRLFRGVCGASCDCAASPWSRRLRARTRWDTMRPQLKLIAGCILTAILGLGPALAQPNADKADNKTAREPAA